MIADGGVIGGIVQLSHRHYVGGILTIPCWCEVLQQVLVLIVVMVVSLLYRNNGNCIVVPIVTVTFWPSGGGRLVLCGNSCDFVLGS